VAPAQRRRISKLDLNATASPRRPGRHAPAVTYHDIRTLTRLVFGSYQANCPHSGPKVHRRYQAHP